MAQTIVAEQYVVTARFSATRRQQDHEVGDVPEHDAQDTVFAKLAVRGTAPRQTWVGGVAFERAALDPRERPAFAYAYNVPGALVERPVGRLRIFANAENLGNVRQTNWQASIRPFRAADGRWTVDAWAPLDGRVINGGVRVAF